MVVELHVFYLALWFPSSRWSQSYLCNTCDISHESHWSILLHSTLWYLINNMNWNVLFALFCYGVSNADSLYLAPWISLVNNTSQTCDFFITYKGRVHLVQKNLNTTYLLLFQIVTIQEYQQKTGWSIKERSRRNPRLSSSHHQLSSRKKYLAPAPVQRMVITKMMEELNISWLEESIQEKGQAKNSSLLMPVSAS